MGFYFIFKMPRDQNDPLWGLKTRRNSLGKNRKKSKNVKSKYHHHGSKSIVMVTNDLWGALMSVPDVDEAPLEPESSSEELWPELLLRLLLALSGTDTLAEVVLVTDTDSTFSWVLTAAFFWLGGKKRGERNSSTQTDNVQMKSETSQASCSTQTWCRGGPAVAAVSSCETSDCGGAYCCFWQRFCTLIWLFWFAPQRRQRAVRSCCKSENRAKEDWAGEPKCKIANKLRECEHPLPTLERLLGV